jgi:hypothetical protein
MGKDPGESPETLVQLVLRAHDVDPLVQSNEDWQALGATASRTLFWCGGAIYACRCEAGEMRFALQLLRTPLGAIAHHLGAGYAQHLRKSRRMSGAIFSHYLVRPLEDDTFLDELILWLHRPAEEPNPYHSPSRHASALWTTESAYLSLGALPWVQTDRVQRALSVGAPGPAAYRRRKLEGVSRHATELFTRRPTTTRLRLIAHSGPREESLVRIARLVADYCEVSYADVLSHKRGHSVSKARVIATILSTRNGATAAALAKLFNRARSTLIEQVEHYRRTQPEIFAAAEAQLRDAIRAAIE